MPVHLIIFIGAPVALVALVAGIVIHFSKR